MQPLGDFGVGGRRDVAVHGRGGVVDPDEVFAVVGGAASGLFLKDIDAEQPLETLAIWKPFSFVLVDDDRETVAELMLFDEDNTLLSQGLMQGLDEELDSFLKDLLAE